MGQFKRILRSIIPQPDDDLDKGDAERNCAVLRESQLVFEDEDDEAVWEFIRSYHRRYNDVPSISSVRDHFRKKNDNVVLETIDEISLVDKLYIGSDFKNLVRAEFVEQKKKTVANIMTTAAHINFGSVEVGRGRNKREYEGTQDAFKYLLEHADEFMISDGGTKLRGDVTQDADGMEKEFEHTVENPEGSWGIVTGLNEIDNTTRGLKSGELWLHAGFTSHYKCVTGDARIYDHRAGRMRTAEELFESGDRPVVTALYEEGKEDRFVEAEAEPVIQNGVQPVYRVELESGRSVRLTGNHPLFVCNEGWVEASDIEEGQYVAVPRKMEVSSPDTSFRDEEVVMAGYLLGDGRISEEMQFTSSNTDLRAHVRKCLVELGYKEGAADYVDPNFTLVDDGTRTPSFRISRSRGLGNSEMTSPLRILLEDLGVWGTDSHSKFIPDEFFALPERQIWLLLSALWATDGSFSSKKPPERKHRNNAIIYSTSSERLAVDVQHLLQRVGVCSRFNTFEGENGVYHHVSIKGNLSKRLFCENVDPVGKRQDRDTLFSFLSNRDNRPFPTELIAHLDHYDRALSPTGHWRYAGQAQKRDTITAGSLRIFGELDQDILRHFDSEIRWERVDSLQTDGEEMTYDLCVPRHGSFVVNGILTHNTSFALAWVYKAAVFLNRNAYYFSLEMPYEQVRRILYAMHSRHPKWEERGFKPIPYDYVRDGLQDDGSHLTDRQKDFFREVIQDFRECAGRDYGSIIVERPDGIADMSYISQQMEIAHQDQPLDIAVIDHFGLVEPSRATGNYYTDLNSILRDAKKMAMNFANGDGIGLVGLHQINRQGKEEADKNNGRYKLQALADANEAERSSDVISYTYFDDDLREAEEVLVGCLKNRDGAPFPHFTAQVAFRNRWIDNLDEQLDVRDGTGSEEIAKMLEEEI